MSDSITKIEEVLDELESEFRRQGRPMQLLTKLRGRLDPLLIKSRPPSLNRPADEWVTALLKQAGNDLHAAETLDLNLQAPTVAMLLQMAFEKMAKAYLAQTDWQAFAAHRRSHAVAKRLTQVLKRDPRLASKLRPRVGPHSNKVLSWIEGLTAAHPALSKNGPHLEYPWEGNDRVQGPNDVSIVKEIGDPMSGAASHLIRYAHFFIGHFDEIKPSS